MTGTDTMSLTARWDSALMRNYGTPPLELVSGRGVTVTASDGREYVDLLSGIAVNSLGHAHPAVVDAVSRQVAELGHVSNLYIHPTVVALAERLESLLSVDEPVRAFFCNSGAEANEAAFKIARRTGRSRILAAENGFHGRTMGALAMTGQPAKREPFEPMPAGVEFFPYGDTAALTALVEQAPGDTAAVIVEPIQGEGGVVEPPEGFLADVRSLCSEHGILMIVDEVQTGIGRTGAMFATRRAGVVPDVITLAKGLGGGLPIGACLAVGAAGELLTAGQHGTTFGGNPVACAAALAVLDTIESEDLIAHVDRLGKIIAAEIECLDHPLVDHVRGRGLLLGVVLTAPLAKAVEGAAREAGYLVGATTADVVRLAPPLVLTEEQVARFVAGLPGILDAATPKEATS
ncbi:MAG: acetylornithine transaminase [Dietzia sp.]|uniref:acetylornithine transaminase n=2 Tax=Dietzia TaxID=37914 RepID=UPI0015FA466A|nr:MULTISPECIES: acetylornithine transaminase [unclassified Dietzia]MBB1040269.1 acetylornithine transaminase [Dietzia sp. Cai40]MBB1050550.1 acetylornithine transaminase [Dietzia sp. CW19]MBB1055504.1 acetylornithine transaminase [Dietzia sp. B44]MBB1057702.1 acetylornithine transaminase [Dietzia sp. B19]MBC7295115.1 acetylornithine transaminase [Dietzia sp.]